MRTAARVARAFKLDPRLVLKADRYDWLVLLASYDVVVEDSNSSDG